MRSVPFPLSIRRRAVILLVVLALLTLFAVIGLSFVLYANGQAQAAQFGREAAMPRRADVDPEQLLALFLGQFLYDVPNDVTGVYSSLRGHSLARSMYGWNDAESSPNDIPFNGTGRLHHDSVFKTLRLADTPPDALHDYYLVNYTSFPDDVQVPPRQRFLRDPERPGWRRDLGADPRPFRGGCNASYTYPDLNNMYLGAVQADGTVLMPAFHRPWLFGSNDPEKNPNWTNAAGKYLLLRPRPIDMGPGFPYPEDAGGDVKNLIGAPGGNDSYWLDLGAPVLRAPDGRAFKPLFAPLVVDLDNRINLNVHGNIRGAGHTHRSNQGWGPWEVNPGRVLSHGAEWSNLLAGTVTPPHVGRYGAGATPGSPGNVAAFPTTPPFYARVDYDGSNEADGSATARLQQLPGFNWPATTCFPGFPAGFGNASSRERTEHPALYNVARPEGDDRAFAVSNLEALLRYGDTGSPALTSELLRLCPQNFGAAPGEADAAARRRRLVTTVSYDVDRPAVTPWVWNPREHPYRLPDGRLRPQGAPIAFPAVNSLEPPPPDSEFQPDWRARTAALGRIDLNRPLPSYPPADPRTGALTDLAAFREAQLARVRLAQDILDRLRAATGAADPTQVPVTSSEYAAVRWLAQLAVNIVDYLDPDDYLTPFPWHPTNPAEVVVGTELPRLVVNEVYVEYSQVTPEPRPRFQVHVWAELHNPLSADPVLSHGGDALLATAGWSVYQLVLSRPNPDLRQHANVLGEADARAIRKVVEFPPRSTVPSSTGDNDSRGFVVVGPPTPFPGGGVEATFQNLDMQYEDGPGTSNDAPHAPTLLLRRLACPHLPPSTDRASPTYNPFVTVDYLELHKVLGLRLNRDSDPLGRRRAYGRAQPYAAQAFQVRAQQAAAAPLPQHTFFRSNQPVKTPFDWLVHLDRPLISPLELLHVSAFKPHELTQQFVTQGEQVFDHRARWLEDNRRLYRVFEFLETLPRAAGMPTAPGGRVPGKININTIWDPETLLALCDPQPSNNFTDSDVLAIYGQLLTSRTPGMVEGTGLGDNDRPFRSLGTGVTTLDPQGQYRNGSGINDTLLRSYDRRQLFQPATSAGPNRHPYLQYQLLTKVFNHLTTRSNVFAVWLTVGFFEVTYERTRPMKLGAELGRAENRHLRHRLFAIVDRSVLTHHPGPQSRFDPRADSPGTDPLAPAEARRAVLYYSIIQ